MSCPRWCKSTVLARHCYSGPRGAESRASVSKGLRFSYCAITKAGLPPIPAFLPSLHSPSSPRIVLSSVWWPWGVTEGGQTGTPADPFYLSAICLWRRMTLFSEHGPAPCFQWLPQRLLRVDQRGPWFSLCTPRPGASSGRAQFAVNVGPKVHTAARSPAYPRVVPLHPAPLWALPRTTKTLAHCSQVW